MAPSPAHGWKPRPGIGAYRSGRVPGGNARTLGPSVWHLGSTQKQVLRAGTSASAVSWVCECCLGIFTGPPLKTEAVGVFPEDGRDEFSGGRNDCQSVSVALPEDYSN